MRQLLSRNFSIEEFRVMSAAGGFDASQLFAG